MFQGGQSTSQQVSIPVAWCEVWHNRPVFVELDGVFAMEPEVVRKGFVAGRGAVIRAYLPDGPPTAVGEYGDPITQADVGSISITVTSGGTAVSGYDGLALAIGDVILDTLQGVGDPRVSGANFVYTLPGDAFPTAGEMATVVVTVVSADETKTWKIEASGRVRAAGE